MSWGNINYGIIATDIDGDIIFFTGYIDPPTKKEYNDLYNRLKDGEFSDLNFVLEPAPLDIVSYYKNETKDIINDD